MTFSKKKILITSITILILSFFWFNQFKYKNEINKGIYIQKEKDNTYSVYFEKFGKKTSLKGGRELKKIIINNVDSLILTSRYGTMIYGNKEDNIMKMWYYFDASEYTNLYGPWTDSVFRRNEVISIGFEFLDSVKTSKEVYNDVNKK